MDSLKELGATVELSDVGGVRLVPQGTEKSVDDLFGVIVKHGRTGSDYQKLLFAIFTAVTDVIREQQQALTPTAYFAVLMSSLSGDNRKAAEDTAVAAQVYLLQIALSGWVRNLECAIIINLALFCRVPIAILRSKFTEIAAVFERILADHLKQAAVVKSV